MSDDHCLEDILRKESPEMLLDTLFDGMYIVDSGRRIVLWNTGAEEITGFSRQEVRGRRCSDNLLNHIDESGNPLCHNGCPIVQTLQTGQTVRVKIYPKTKTGRRFPVMTHISPIRDASGAIVGAIEVFRDITKEEDLRILQEKFQALIRKYVSSATFEEVLAQARSGQEREPRIRDLTILHLDVVGFTPFAEHRPPADVSRMLNDLFGLCEVITQECCGDIDKFIGDAVLAVFVDANDAVAAAGRILAALEHLNARRGQEGQDRISVRVGIHSGNVIQGEIGTPHRRDLTVLGDVVNTAVRIEESCPANTVAISEATRSRLSRPDAFAFGRNIRLKGRQQEVPIYLPAGQPQEPKAL